LWYWWNENFSESVSEGVISMMMYQIRSSWDEVIRLLVCRVYLAEGLAKQFEYRNYVK
jgi:hypothetical protein